MMQQKRPYTPDQLAARDKFKRGKHYRWVAVMHVFAIGKTNAHHLCQRFGLDPDELVS